MSQTLEIRICPGKGLGVFALRDLVPGVILFEDKPIAFIFNKERPEITDADVNKAFDGLSNKAKKDFLALSEGSYSSATQYKRIYQSNCFGWNNGKGNSFSMCLAFKMSRLNHSCIPNATWNRKPTISAFSHYVTYLKERRLQYATMRISFT